MRLYQTQPDSAADQRDGDRQRRERERRAGSQRAVVLRGGRDRRIFRQGLQDRGIADVAIEQVQSRIGQRAQRLGQSADDQGPDDERLERDPHPEHGDRRQEAPKRHVPAIVARQRGEAAGSAAGEGEGAPPADPESECRQCQ